MSSDNSDKIEQNTKVSGQARVGQVIQIGKIVGQFIDERIFDRLGLEQRVGFILLGTLIIVAAVGVFFSLHQVLQALRPQLPSRMTTGNFHVAVAGFAEKGHSEDSEIGTDLAQVVYSSLERAFEKMDLGFAVWGPEQVGNIEGQNRDERVGSAEQIAETIGADMVVYGVVDTTTVVWQVVPEFYVSLENFYEAQEIVGQYEIGTPISILGQGDIADRFDLQDELTPRMEALSYLAVGLSFYAHRNFERALTFFRVAETVPGWDDSEGKDVVYLLAGNAAGKNGDFETAEHYYNQARDINPDYARVYAGLGNLRYDQAVVVSTESVTETALILLDESMDYYHQALSATVQPAQSDIYAKVHFGLGRVYFWQALLLEGDMFQAAQEFEWVIADYNESQSERLRERAAAAHASLGLIYRLSAEDTLSIAEYKQAIDLIEGIPQLQEQLATYYAALGDEYVDAGRLDDAMVAYRQAIQLAVSPETIVDYQNRLERVQSKIGDF